LAKWMWLRLLCHMWGRSRGKPLFLASPPSTNCKMTSPWLQIGSRFLLWVWQGFYRSQWRSTWKSPAKGPLLFFKTRMACCTQFTAHCAACMVWYPVCYWQNYPSFSKIKKNWQD
jgi:hypothetical protein